MRQGLFSQANNVGCTHLNGSINGHEGEIAEAIESLATATAADRSANAALTTTVADLTAQLAEAHKQLAAVNAQLLTAQRNAKQGGGRGGGRGRGAKNTSSASFQARVGGPSGRHYCWSCGDHCYHKGQTYRSKLPGHKDDATAEDKMDGSSHSFA